MAFCVLELNLSGFCSSRAAVSALRCKETILHLFCYRQLKYSVTFELLTRHSERASAFFLRSAIKPTLARLLRTNNRFDLLLLVARQPSEHAPASAARATKAAQKCGHVAQRQAARRCVLEGAVRERMLARLCGT